MKTGRISTRLMGVIFGVTLAFTGYGQVYAAEAEEQTENGREEYLISVELPEISEESDSLFDFILDPQGLINATHAVRYGGRTFEEGATLYFENTDGEYNFSSTSDFLSITSRSTVPIRVRINAYLKNWEEMGLSADSLFGEEDAYLYLALTDDRGNVAALEKDGSAELIYEITVQDESDAGTYSFGLTGNCNPDADWSLISMKPHITVTWIAEPVMPEEETEDTDAFDDDTAAEEETVKTDAQNTDAVTEESGSGENEQAESGDTGEAKESENPAEGVDADNSDDTEDTSDTGTTDMDGPDSGGDTKSDISDTDSIDTTTDDGASDIFDTKEADDAGKGSVPDLFAVKEMFLNAGQEMHCPVVVRRRRFADGVQIVAQDYVKIMGSMEECTTGR